MGESRSRFTLNILGANTSIANIFGGDKIGSHLLINKPQGRSFLLRIIETSFSALFWVFFLYFCYPLLIATFSLFIDHWLILYFSPYSSPKSTLEMILYTFIFALFILFLLISWSSWNYWCYGGLDRRKPPTMVPNSTLALVFNIPLETIINARDAKYALITPTQSSFTLTLLKRLSSTSPCLYLERVSPLPWKKLTDASLKTKKIYFPTIHRKLLE